MSLLLPPSLGVADAITFGVGAAAFQMFACMTTALMLHEASSRVELARMNTELRETRARLAENSRAAERLRIARDLHDTLGHHLTALSVQLDFASRVADANAAPLVRTAHALTRLLLGEVRAVVAGMRDDRGRDLVPEVRELAAAARPGLAIHLDVPHQLRGAEPAQAHALLRCVQEIITNTTRHAHARNLWIAVACDDNRIELRARDDGAGADTVHPGNGLHGMRERFAECSGQMEFQTRPGGGFAIRGYMPQVQTTG
jgi:signal transduction histidine kinase